MFIKKLALFFGYIRERYRRISIKYKVILLLMCICAVSVGLTTLAYVTTGAMYIKQNQKNELSVLADIIGDKNAAALAFNEQGIIRANLDMLSGKESIQMACVYNAKRQVFAHYILSQELEIHCPHPNDETLTITNNAIELFHTIRKNGSVLGYVYIKSGLQVISDFIRRAVLVAVATVISVSILAFLLALKLQGMISKPIVDLANEAKAVFTDEGFGLRARNVYYDELGEIADSFNKILEEREAKHQQFFTKHQEMSEVFKTSEKTLAILDDEAIYPFKAASTFKQMLEMQAFGPLHENYACYFNDVYAAEVDLYHVLLTAIDTFKLQSEIFQIGQETLDITNVMDHVLETRIEKERCRHIHFSLATKHCVYYTAYRKPFERMIDTLISLFLESKEMGYFYNCGFCVDHIKKGHDAITAEFYRRDNNSHYCNDNYNETTLGALIKHLKHNEPVFAEEQDVCINFDDVSIRNLLYSLHFLSDINRCEIRVRLSAHKMVFLFTLDVNASGEQIGDDTDNIQVKEF